MTSTRRRPSHLLKTRASVYPKAIDETFEEYGIDPEILPYKKLYDYVLMRAINDLSEIGSNARDWFGGESTCTVTFAMCCDSLDLDESSVRKVLIKRGLL